MDCDIVFLGGVFPKEKKDEIIESEKGNIQNAANILQWNYIEGLDYFNKKPIKLINAIFIGSYPQYNKNLFIKSYPFSHVDGADDINVKFFNLRYYKNISRRKNCYKELKKWANEKNDRKKIIYIYSLHLPFLNAAIKLKKSYPNIKLINIIPDLPQYMNLTKNKSFIFKLLKTIDEKRIQKCIPKLDFYILLTKYMAEELKIKDNYLVIEGMINNKIEKDYECIKDNYYFDILYTGTINEKYGIMNIVHAVDRIESDRCRLIICGEGDAKQKIIDISKNNNRIIYKGLLKREAVLELQRSANLLINIRSTEEEYTKFSFPSKNMEYIASGTPLLCSKIKGMPDEYKDYVYLVEDDTIESISNKIIVIMNKSQEELNCFGAKAKEWLFTQKNNIIQTKKIIDLWVNVFY